MQASSFCWLLNLNLNTVCPCLGMLKVRECRKVRNFEKFLSQNTFFYKYRLGFFHKIINHQHRVEKQFVRIQWFLFLHCLLDFRKNRRCPHYRLIWNKKITDFSLCSECQINFFYFFWKIEIVQFKFRPRSGIALEKNAKSSFILDTLRFWNSFFFSSTCFSSLSRCQSIAFNLNWIFVSQYNEIFFFTSELESSLRKTRKSFIGIEISWLSNAPFSKTTKLSSSIKVWSNGDKILHHSDLEDSSAVSYILMFLGWTCGKVQTTFLLRRFSISKFSKATVLISANKVSLGVFFVNFGFFVEVVRCMFIFCPTLLKTFPQWLRLSFMIKFATNFKSCCVPRSKAVMHVFVGDKNLLPGSDAAYLQI